MIGRSQSIYLELLSKKAKKCSNFEIIFSLIIIPILSEIIPLLTELVISPPG